MDCLYSFSLLDAEEKKKKKDPAIKLLCGLQRITRVKYAHTAEKREKLKILKIKTK